MQKTRYFNGESSGTPEADMLWPFRLKLTTDHLRWDSLKIQPSEEFEEHIVAKLDESSRKILDAKRPIEIHFIDIDINETYKVNLLKKESFWFQPLPDVVQKQNNSKSKWIKSKSKSKNCQKLPPMDQQDSLCHSTTYDHDNNIDMENAREEFAYSIEPFKHIVKKRNLSNDKEIGLRWSGDKTTIKYEFSVLYTPMVERLAELLTLND